MPTLVAHPQEGGPYRGRSNDCQKALEMPLLSIIDQASKAGWQPKEIARALGGLIRDYQEVVRQDGQLDEELAALRTDGL